ncbi:MAG: nucleotide exchange factor GrpE [Paludibacteraceae bacterium]|nr:nucleotide exchange factor GrpE [Paludibacteraceae bacterium]
MDEENINQQINEDENLNEEILDNSPEESCGENVAIEDDVDEVTKMAERIAELEAQVASLKDEKLRMMAEFDNFRKKKTAELAAIKNVVADGFFRDMLPVIDDLERAIVSVESATDIEAVKEGISLIYKKFIDYLRKNGVEAIETANADFDTNLHEAIAVLPAQSEEQKNKIIDCTTRGYKHGDTVIRHAKVVVGQ